jgi:hypothetical protein
MVLSIRSKKEKIYDRVRNLWVSETPEEIVRQTLLNKMIDELSYPKELIVIEKSLSEIPLFSSITTPLRRIDIACFSKNIHPKHSLYPLLLIECKESKDQAMQALEQVKGYNCFLKAYFIAVAYPGGEVFGFLEGEKFRLLNYLPPYEQLTQAVSL